MAPRAHQQSVKAGTSDSYIGQLSSDRVTVEARHDVVTAMSRVHEDKVAEAASRCMRSDVHKLLTTKLRQAVPPSHPRLLTILSPLCTLEAKVGSCEGLFLAHARRTEDKTHVVSGPLISVHLMNQRTFADIVRVLLI